MSATRLEYKTAAAVPADIERKDSPVSTGLSDVTVAGDEGEVTAIVSITGIEDEVKDVILPGAYTETLTKRHPKGVWSHDWNVPIARVPEAVELPPGDPRLPTHTKDGKPWPDGAGGLLAKLQFNLATQAGREAFETVKFFSDSGECEWSIGYRVPRGGSVKRRDGVREIKKLELYEVSPVLFGAAPQTSTLSLKSAVATMNELRGESPLETKDEPADDSEEGGAPEDDDAGPPAEEELEGLFREAAGDIDAELAEANPPGPPGRTEDAGEDGEGPPAEDGPPAAAGEEAPAAGEPAGAEACADGGKAGAPDDLEVKDFSDRSWGDYTAADYTPEQWHAACLIHLHDPGTPDSKGDCKLPVKEPGGAYNKGGIHAAAAALAGARGGVAAPRAMKVMAAKRLVGLYRKMGEDPPDSLTNLAGGGKKEAQLRLTVAAPPAREAKAAGVDTHPGAAERLRQYWEHGEGAAKINWGVPGDYNRCVRLLSKYLGQRAHGYCQLRHKGATGAYAGHAPGEGGKAHNPLAVALVDELMARIEQKRTDDGSGGGHGASAGTVATGQAPAGAFSADQHPRDALGKFAVSGGGGGKGGKGKGKGKKGGGARRAAQLTAKAEQLAATTKAQQAEQTRRAAFDEHMKAEQQAEQDRQKQAAAEIQQARQSGDSNQASALQEQENARHAAWQEQHDKQVAGEKQRRAEWDAQAKQQSQSQQIAAAQQTAANARASAAGKSLEGGGMDIETKDAPYLAGSYEERTNALRDTIQAAVQAGAPLPDADAAEDEAAAGAGDQPARNMWVSVEGTYDDHVVVTVYNMTGDGDRDSYLFPYTFDAASGQVQVGEPQPVTLTVLVEPGDADEEGAGEQTESAPAEPDTAAAVASSVDAATQQAKLMVRYLEGLAATGAETKAGRVLSSNNAGRLREALNGLISVLAAAGVDVGELVSPPAANDGDSAGSKSAENDDDLIRVPVGEVQTATLGLFASSRC